MLGKRKGIPKGLGEAADPRPALKRAQTERKQAKDPYGLDERQAAEKAYLAATQAADVVAAKLLGRKPEGTGGRYDALARLDKQKGTQTAQAFSDVRLNLHEDCFHEGRCTREGLDEGFAAAKRLVADVRKHVGFTPYPPPKPRGRQRK